MENKFWCEFLDLYKRLPALWCIKSSNYSNRILKASAYNKLVQKLREIYPDANQEMVVKKLNFFHTTYYKELKKVEECSQKCSAKADEIYEPSLWYFEKLSFLADQEECAEGRSTMKDKNGANLTSNQKKKIICEDDNHIKKACKQLESNWHANSDTDLLAKSWASQYKEMQENQKLLARKIISDILFHGSIGTLNISHTRDIQEILLHESSAPESLTKFNSRLTKRPRFRRHVLNFNKVSSDILASSKTYKCPRFEVVSL